MSSFQFSQSKSSVIQFGPKQERKVPPAAINISSRGFIVPQKEEVLNLGVWLISNLRFTKHIIQLNQSSYNAVRELYPHRSTMSPEVKLKICEELIVSKMAYCDAVYCPALLNVDINRLKEIQNACFSLRSASESSRQ